VSTDIFSLEGKVAIVTGASRGIGKAIALGMARAGADIGLASRTEADLKDVAQEIEGMGRRAVVIPTDVMSRDAIQEMVDRTVSELGRLDVLVNNAGGTRFMAPLVGLRPEGWDKVIALNLNSVFHATQIGAQAMLDSGGGSIIQISSVAGIEGAPGLSFYSAAKGGVRLMTQAVAKELAQSGVRVNSIAPGWIATDLNQQMQDDEASLALALSMVPMGRLGEVDEIVGAAIYLASDAASYVTGSTIVIDGGQTA
jgi:2-deoxy-D-gluconate 3-dehydrogenase